MTPDRTKNQVSASRKMMIFLLVVIAINLILTGLGFYLLFERLDRSGSLLASKHELARDISDYSNHLATELGVREEAQVKEALTDYNYALDVAATSEDLVQAVLTEGRALCEAIHTAAETRLKERVLDLVNRDAKVRQTEEKTHLFLHITDSVVTVFPEEVLEAATLKIINALVGEYSYPVKQNIDLEIEKGSARLIVPQTTEEQTEALTDDLHQVRLKLYELRVQAGLAEMVGPGITLYVYDAESLTDSSSIVHDVDIRDIVNELFSAGAKGISVGGERLTVTSSIRCSGPLIMVNYRQVATNPVVIEAIGEPDLLISGLSIIVSELEAKRDLLFVVNQSGFIKLAAFSAEDLGEE